MSTLSAEVISIGDEMTSGAKLDTNSPWLSQRLGELGVQVRFQSMVGDALQDNVDVFRIAAARADVVIATGGLGPTADDLTRDALSIVSGRPLVLQPSALAHIESLFRGRGREMPPRNRVQAMFPEGALEIFNPQGTAPGIDLTLPRPGGGAARIFALPGVPAEMKGMFQQVVAPRLVEQLGGQRRVIRQAVVKCFGLGESDMEAKLGDMIARDRVPRVGITVSAATISLRITAEAEDEAACWRMIDATRQEIGRCAGEYIFGEGEDCELQDALGQILADRGQRLATLEAGHGSMLAGWLAGIRPGQVFAGGQVVGAVRSDEAELRQRLQALDADWLLVVAGYPNLWTEADSLAEVTISLCGRHSGEFWQSQQQLGGHPSILHPRIGKAGLAFARSRLLDHPARA